MSIGGTRYIPSNHIVFCGWVKVMSAYAALNHRRWGVEAFDAGIAAKLDRLEVLASLCTTSKHTAEDIVERNVLRKEIEREVRSYLQGMVIRNKHVTELDRTAMGLPLRDTVRTPTGEPVGQAEADITYPGRTQLLLRIRHVEGTSADAKANYGYRIYYGVYTSDQSLPAAGKDLYDSRFTRQKKELFAFEQSDSGKTACFCIRYENSRGKPGPWGPMFSAVIP